MLRRFWDWYFWGTAPVWTPGARWGHRLWWATHPRWLREIRTALMVQRALEEEARSGALRAMLGKGRAAREE